MKLSLIVLFLLCAAGVFAAAPSNPILNPREAAVSGFDSSTLNASVEELIIGMNKSGNVTRIVSGKLVVPWFGGDNVCAPSNLQSGGNCNIGTVNFSQYCMVTDELSQVGLILSMANSTWEPMFHQYFLTLQAVNSSRGQIPSWKILVNETAGTLSACDSRTNSNCDSASDATAREIISLFDAANNSLFLNATNKANYYSFAINLSRDFVLYEVDTTCRNSTLGQGNICYWLAAGWNAKNGGLSSTDYAYAGYYPDAIMAMQMACRATGNLTYCSIAGNFTLNYLQAAYPPGTSLSTFRVPPGRSFKFENASTQPVAVCTNTCTPDQWDDSDAPRAYGLGLVVYYAQTYNLTSTIPLLRPYMDLWAAQHMQSFNSVPLQFYSNGSASSANQSGYKAQGLQSQGLSYNDTQKFNTTLRNALDHYDTATDTMDFAACFGVYGQAFPIRSLQEGIGRNGASWAYSVSTDTTAPVISNGQPSGNLSGGTFQTMMNVTTDEAATCRLGLSDVAYGSLSNEFSTTGGTTHSQSIAGLTNGSTYTYYVRCRDALGNTNTASYAVTWSVTASTTSSSEPSGGGGGGGGGSYSKIVGAEIVSPIGGHVDVCVANERVNSFEVQIYNPTGTENIYFGEFTGVKCDAIAPFTVLGKATKILTVRSCTCPDVGGTDRGDLVFYDVDAENTPLATVSVTLSEDIMGVVKQPVLVGGAIIGGFILIGGALVLRK